MQDEPAVILFASNLSTSAPRASTFKEFYTRIRQRIARTNINNFFRLVTAYTNLEILDQLHMNGARMVVFHFEGRSENFEKFSEVCEGTIGSLPTYLGQQPQLRVVFLSGCATDTFIEDLLHSGVPAVVTSSHHLPVAQIEHFAETVYAQLIAGSSIEEAVEVGKRNLQVGAGPSQRIFVNLRGETRARNYRPLVPHVVTEPRRNGHRENGYHGSARKDEQATTKPGGKGTEPPPPPPPPPPSPQPEASPPPPPPRGHPSRNWQRPHPFVGNRPYTRADADIFYGRDDEVTKLVNLVKSTDTAPFILLSGPAGCGKTSLIQAGLLCDLKDEFEVIELNGNFTPELVSVLRGELARRTGQANLLDAWLTMEGNYNVVKGMTERRVLLIVDNIDGIVHSLHPRDRREIPKLLSALYPLYAATLFRSHSKILLSARSFEARDVSDTLARLAIPCISAPLTVISRDGLLEAIAAPFRGEPSPGRIKIDDETAFKIRQDLLVDPSSAQLPFLQAIIECLWRTTYSQAGFEETISRSIYDRLYKSCELLANFLDTQLLRVREQLDDRVDEETLLRILWHHCSPHHLPTQRRLRERHLQFPQLDAQVMHDTLNALCDHYLLMPVPAELPGNLQIAHRELSPLVRERLIRRGISTNPWWQQLMSSVTSLLTIVFAGTGGGGLLNLRQEVLTNQEGKLSLHSTDLSLILLLFALILACLIAGFLFDRLIS